MENEELNKFIGQVVRGSREDTLLINIPKGKTLLKYGDYVEVYKIVLKRA